MTFELKKEIIIKEWGIVDTNIGRLDTIIFLIRGWSISTTTVTIGYAYSKNNNEVLDAMLLGLALFWVLDALFKNFQHNFISRSREIEIYLSSSQFISDYNENTSSNFKSPDYANRFGSGSFFERLSSHLGALFLRNVFLTYFFLSLAVLFARWQVC